MNNHRAFTVVELLVVMFLVLAFFMLLVIPATSKHPQKAIRIQCVNNLKQNGLAFRIWAGDNNDLYPMQYRMIDFDGPSHANEKQMFMYFQMMSNELSNPKMVLCPTEEKRTAATNFTTDFDSSHVSYFVGLDANGTNEGNFLAGDRNLTGGGTILNGVVEIMTNHSVGWTEKMHKRAGNVLFTDGHVEQLSPSKLNEALRKTGMVTNRLVFPEELK